MYLKVFDKYVPKDMSLNVHLFICSFCSFSYCTRVSMASSLKKDQSKYRPINFIDMLLMAENDVRVGIRHDIDKYVANNKS